MCIAILNTKGATLKKELLSNCWKNNGDGAGILYISDSGELKISKEMHSFEKFYASYQEIKKKYGKKRNMVLHFRISTHGRVNETNCHPFLVDKNVGFVHNGMIYNVETSTEFSDTYMFNETILKKLKPGFETDEAILDMLETYIGSGSKLIFLNASDEYAIVNDKAGHWNMECWFSNSSYKQVNNYVDYGGVKKYKNSYGSYGSYGSGTSYWGYSSQHKKVEQKSINSLSLQDSFIDDKNTPCCSNCDIDLYGVAEIDRGTCAWCHEEEMAMAEAREAQELDVCESCMENHGAYQKEWQAHVCEDCMLSLTDGMGA